MSGEDLDYHVLDVFTEQRLAGNPLAVVMQADALSSERMQDIAREFNLSETVFVLQPRGGADARVRIFTPSHELPFAGHPTVGSACLLAELGVFGSGEQIDVVLEEEVGPVPVRIRRAAGRAAHAQLSTAVLPSFAPALAGIDELAALLSLSPDDIEIAQDAPRGASCGVPYNLVPLRSLEALRRSRLKPALLDRLGEHRWSTAFYLYCRDAEPDTLRARMYAPDLGVGEDPATGSAAAALCGHLADRAQQGDATLSWSIHQGVEMQRPSLIEIQADKREGRITAVRVGGYAVRVACGRLLL
ncbi:PhzF family phenazine biosynthesis protein [Hydrocarboniphaga sp.]|uniref:PhzF family phenazine biosynthesis protein n=1 Tax=Hydrocarboniphaga sp. TaxID=2033016 RepID=UPI003D1048D0